MYIDRILVLLGVALTCYGQVSDDWITVIYEENFGEDLDFECSTPLPSNQPPNGSIPVRWMFNDLTNDEAGSNSTKYMISADAYTMTLLNVQKEDFGVYHCMLMTPENEWYLIKLGLNVRGPYYEDLWEKYRMNTIIGLSAFFGVLVFAIGIILVYKYRYIPEEEPEVLEKPFVLPASYGSQDTPNGASYTNAAYTDDQLTTEL